MVPWYWILIILSAIAGPFEAMHAVNKARQKREEQKRKQDGAIAARQVSQGQQGEQEASPEGAESRR